MNYPPRNDVLSAVKGHAPEVPDHAETLTETELGDDDLEEISGGLAEDVSCPSYEPD